MEQNREIIVLNDENGEEMEFEFLTVIEYQDAQYAVLMPCDDDSGEVLILQVEPGDEDEDEEVYSEVESDEVIEAAFELFKEKCKDEFDFV